MSNTVCANFFLLYPKKGRMYSAQWSCFIRMGWRNCSAKQKWMKHSYFLTVGVWKKCNVWHICACFFLSKSHQELAILRCFKFLKNTKVIIQKWFNNLFSIKIYSKAFKRSKFDFIYKKPPSKFCYPLKEVTKLYPKVLKIVQWMDILSQMAKYFFKCSLCIPHMIPYIA